MTIDRVGGLPRAAGLDPADSNAAHVKGRVPAVLGDQAGAAASGLARLPDQPLRSDDVGGLVRDLAGSPPVDMSRVAALKAAIEAGTYALDPSAIADSMLATELSSR